MNTGTSGKIMTVWSAGIVAGWVLTCESYGEALAVADRLGTRVFATRDGGQWVEVTI
jgi:hypothetical protein